MTPAQLLEATKALISPILLIDDETLLKQLTMQALGEYESRVGALAILKLTEEQAKSGLDVSALGINDSNFLHAIDAGMEPYLVEVENGVLTIADLDRWVKYPLKATYFVSMGSLDFDTGVIPVESIPMLKDYLKVLIDIPNNGRVYSAYQSSGIGIESLPVLADLTARKSELELRMNELTGVMPSATVF